MTVTEKVAYLKGLIEGFAVDENTKEGKMLKAMMDVLSDLAVSVEDLEDSISDLTDQVDAIDEDLDALEGEVYGADDECSGCEDCEDEFYDICCPNCNEEFCVDEETLMEGGIECPNCGEHLEFDIDGSGEDDECGCDCCHEDDK